MQRSTLAVLRGPDCVGIRVSTLPRSHLQRLKTGEPITRQSGLPQGERERWARHHHPSAAIQTASNVRRSEPVNIINISDHRFRVRQASEGANLDPVRDPWVLGARDHPQQGQWPGNIFWAFKIFLNIEILDISYLLLYLYYLPKIWQLTVGSNHVDVAGVQQGGGLVGAGRAYVRDGCRLPALLRWPAHSDLRENCVGTGEWTVDTALTWDHTFTTLYNIRGPGGQDMFHRALMQFCINAL